MNAHRIALLIARDDIVDADKLMARAGVVRASAQAALYQLAQQGHLERVTRGVYEITLSGRNALSTHVSPHPLYKRGTFVPVKERQSYAEYIAEVDAWLADKPALPPARPPVFRERGGV